MSALLLLLACAVATAGCGRLGFGSLASSDDGAIISEGDATSDGSTSDGRADDALGPSVTMTFGDSPSVDYPNTAADATIEQATPTENYGILGTLEVGTGLTVLMRFDLSAVPPGAVVTAASLQLTVKNAGSGGTAVIYRVLEAWVEGVGGSAGLVGPASWNERLAAVAWTNPGVGAPSSRAATQAAAHPLDVAALTTIPLDVAMAQFWIDNPTQNFGFAIVSSGFTSSANFTASEAAVAAERPVLALSIAQ